MKKGILLINLGTPKSPTAKHLRPYLRRFLGDKRVIATPDVIWKPVLELMILPRRPKFSAQMYKKIWSAEYGSPLAYYTKRQAELLQALVPDTVVKYAFSYSEPDISQVLAEFEAQKVTELCIIALYPQYSTTTVGSVSDDVMRFYHKRTYVPNLKFVTSFYESEAYLKLLADKIKEYWSKKVYDKLIISYHGIPEILHTYQSKFGPAKWLEPATDETIKHLPKQGCKKLLVISPSFVADCLETLYELELENRTYFEQAGGEVYDVVPCLNDDPEFVAFLKDLSK